MFHSAIKIQPHLSQQEGKKTLAQIWAGSHQVRVKLLGKTSALSFLVLKRFPVPVFTFTSAQGWCIQTRTPVSSWPHPTGPQYSPLHRPETSFHRSGVPFQPPFSPRIHQGSVRGGLGTADKLVAGIFMGAMKTFYTSR